MKNLSKNEMNAVVGGIGPKASVSGALGGLDGSKRSTYWELYAEIREHLYKWEPPLKFY